MVSVPILSLPFVLNKLIPFRNALCLKILFQSALGLPQQISSEAFLRNALNLILKVKYTSEKSVGVEKKRPLPRHGSITAITAAITYVSVHTAYQETRDDVLLQLRCAGFS